MGERSSAKAALAVDYKQSALTGSHYASLDAIILSTTAPLGFKVGKQREFEFERFEYA